MNSIGKRIKENRKNKGLTQEELAEKARLNLRTIQRIENAECEPRGKTLSLICDVLEIEMYDLTLGEDLSKEKNKVSKFIQVLFIIVLNFMLVGIIGFLTLDSNATMNSVFGGVLLSVLIPLFIVYFTREINRNERILKFGFGYILYFLLVIFLLGFPIGFKTGILPCLMISLFFLYFGDDLTRKAV